MPNFSTIALFRNCSDMQSGNIENDFKNSGLDSQKGEIGKAETEITKCLYTMI